MGVAVLVTVIGLSSASAAIVLRATWVSGTSSAGSNFYGARGITVGRHGDLYVADNIYHRIEKLSPDGRFLMTWGWGVKDGKEQFEICRHRCRRGRYGSGDGRFDGPMGVATDGKGHVYVADGGNHRIQKFSAQGRFLRSFGHRSGPGGIHSPVGVAADPEGHVYVADYYGSKIVRFASGGRFLGEWSAPDPYAVGADHSGHVYVGEYFADRIEKFSDNGDFLRTWGWGVRNGAAEFQVCVAPRSNCTGGLSGSGKGQFEIPSGIATDESGAVYVADDGNNHWFKFAPGGRLRAQRERHDPGSLTVDRRGRIYVLAPPGVIVYSQ